jgi:hypothetical protein
MCRCKENPNRVLQQPTYNDEYREKQRQITLDRFKDPANRKSHSDVMKQVVLDNPDSYNAKNICGRSKYIEYKGNTFHSKWEVVVASFLDEINVKWERDVKPIPYFWQDDWHLYFPDFYLPEINYFIEVKGYERDRDRCKWSALNNLIIIKEADIKLIKAGKYNLGVGVGTRESLINSLVVDDCS